MNLTRCENGHFYDAERFDTCPHCNQTSVSTVFQDENGESMYTAAVTEGGSVVAGSQFQKLIDESKDDDDTQKTVGYFGNVDIQPVVGWLVAIGGSHFGEDFKLKSGRNFIGRSGNMDVSLSKDGSISREKHAIVLYEPKSNIFLVQPGDAKELFYLNDKVVLTATEIKAYDKISLGETKMLFVPCCSESFNWDAAKSEEEKK